MSVPGNIERDTPGVIARPPFIYLAFLAAGIILNLVWPTSLVSTSFTLRIGLGASIGLFGLIVGITGRNQFRMAKTNPNPMRTSTALVVEGPYRFTRNPMYLGLTLLYFGIAFGANNAWMLGLMVPLLVVMHFGVIVREEAYMERKFGDSYRQYRASVRRWV